jgi:hypothetical protein
MVAAVEFLVPVVVGCLIAWWLVGSESGRATLAARSEARSARAAKGPQVLSRVGTRVDEDGPVLACPRCGGTQFQAHRRLSTKLMFGAASLLGQAKHVRCVTCGTDYLRG